MDVSCVYIHRHNTYIHTHKETRTHTHDTSRVCGCIPHFRKRALSTAALLRKETCNLRHPMHLRHPVLCVWVYIHTHNASREVYIHRLLMYRACGYVFLCVCGYLYCVCGCIRTIHQERYTSTDSLYYIHRLSVLHPQTQ